MQAGSDLSERLGRLVSLLRIPWITFGEFGGFVTTTFLRALGIDTKPKATVQFGFWLRKKDFAFPKFERYFTGPELSGLISSLPALQQELTLDETRIVGRRTPLNFELKADSIAHLLCEEMSA